MRRMIHNTTAIAACLSLLMPPVGFATGVLALGEPLRASLLAGCAVILVGLAVIVWPSRRAAK